MIKEKIVKLKLNSRNVHRYKQLGYEIPKSSSLKNSKLGYKRGQTIEVRIEDLSSGCKVKVTHICEDCGLERAYPFRDAVSTKYCRKCSAKGSRNAMYRKAPVLPKDRKNGETTKPAMSKEEAKLRVNICGSLHCRIQKALKCNYKSSIATKYLGCSIQEFKNYIESLFQPGMSWDNWSHSGWHLDHVIPLSKFDFASEEDALKACHYSNYQPMWAKNNVKKRDSLPKVYFLFGCFGSGKTTLVNSLKDKFHVYSYDDFKKHPIELLQNPPDFDKPILYESPVLVSTFMKLAQNKLDVIPVYQDVSDDQLRRNLSNRGKRINLKSLINRKKRLQSLAKKYSAKSVDSLFSI